MKLFVCCLLLCAFGVIAQAQSQDLPEVAAAKAAHFEAVRRAELLIANAPPVSHHPRPAVIETTQHKLGQNVHDTPEVAAAKVAHFEAVRNAEYATYVANATGQVPNSRPIGTITMPILQPPAPVYYAAPAVHPYNLEVNVYDTPKIAAARAIHNEAVRRAQQTSGAVSNEYLYTHFSAPVDLQDTPEVAVSKAALYDAVRRAEIASAASNSNDGSYGFVPGYQEPASIVPVADRIPVIAGVTFKNTLSTKFKFV